MKALFIPHDGSFDIELIADNEEDHKNLVDYYQHDSMSVSCEEWREQSRDAQDALNEGPTE